MSKRTNKIYNVQLARYAWVAVEADSPSDAMEKAEEYLDNGTIDIGDLDEDFEDSEVDVNACESYSREIDDFHDDDVIYTDDGEKDYDEYVEELED